MATVATTRDRLRPATARALFDLDLLQLGRQADAARRRILGSDDVGFVVDRNITFTNRCEIGCRFCAFHTHPDDAGHRRSFQLSIDDILQRVGELVEAGGTQVMLQGGICRANNLAFYTHMLSRIKQRFPDVHLHSLSPAEIHALATFENRRVRDVLQQLISAGLDSLPGAAEILVDRVRRRVSPHKLMTDDWLHIMRTAHQLGIHTTATMTFGLGETLAERIEHLDRIRSLQNETGGFKAFIPWTFSPRNTRMPEVPESLGVDYLKTVAISRLYLDNIPHIHAGWVTEGAGLAQTALAFGADDFGGVLMEEVVVKATGTDNRLTVDAIVRLIRDAGRVPVQRNSRYESLRRYSN